MAFEIITFDQLKARLDKYDHKELHVHHTWSPTKKSWDGTDAGALRLQQAMKDFHMNVNRWSDIGQHVTLLPDGRFVTGRPFGTTPASISGYNTGGFAMEMLGDFDKGYEVFEGAQRESSLRLADYFKDRGRYVRFHRENAPKTCPGTSIDKAAYMADANITDQVLAAAPVAMQDPSVRIGSCRADVLNVRSSPEIKDGNVIGKLKKGDPVKIGFRKGNWWNIFYGDHGGWVSADYVAVEPMQMRVNATMLNVRSAPAVKDGNIIGKLNIGDPVKAGWIENGWANIYFGSGGGYVSAEYLK
jgi:uncharacterized protein YraI